MIYEVVLTLIGVLIGALVTMSACLIRSDISDMRTRRRRRKQYGCYKLNEGCADDDHVDADSVGVGSGRDSDSDR